MKKYDNIPGFPGYYVSKRGTLWSRYSNKKLTTDTWVKKKFYKVKRNGRFRTSMSHEQLGKIKVYRYRLVALAWVPNPNHKLFVCHIDNNPTNDYYKNLYWGTPMENMHQMMRDNRWYTPFTNESNPNKGKRGWQLHTKIDKQQFISIIKLRESGLTNSKIISQLGLKLSSAAISRIWKRYQEGYYNEVLNL